MTDTEGVRAVTCPSCGARIHVAEGEYRTTCEYCGSLLQLPHPSQPEAEPVILEAPPKSPPRTVKVRPTRCGPLVLALAVGMMVVVGLVVYFVIRGVGAGELSGITSAISSQRASLPALILPTGGAGGPDVLVYTYDTLQDTRFLSYIDGGTQSVRWPSDPLGEDSYRAALAVDDTKVFAVVKTRVFALDRQSGSLAWEASISDEIPYSCPDDCLMVVGQRVVVLSRDGRLAGFDAQSGQTVWNTRLNSTPDQLYAVNGQLAVFDNRDGAVVLLVIDPVDGSEQETLTPECTDPSSGFVDDPGFNSQVLVTPDQRSLVLLFGFFSSCVQRWDIASGSMAWNASLGDVAFSHAFGPTSIISGDSVYVAGDNQLLTVGLTDGIWTVLTDDPDYELVPLGTRDGVLITRAKRTRGSTRFELWGLEMSTGRQVWQHPLPDSEPLDEPDRMSGLIDKGDSAWTAHLTAEGLVVVTAMAEPHQLTVETLDPATGTSAGATPIPLAGITGGFYAVPDVVAWVDDQLWLIVEGRVYAVSPAQGALEFKWP